ncbi:MAG: PqqD family protein [Lysobacter sp.]
MAHSDEQSYYVIPLSVQREGDGYYIGNAELGEFYEFPEVGLRIVQRLQAGDSAGAIKSALAGAETEDTLDVDDFIAQLRDIGFIHLPQDQGDYQQQLAQSAVGDRRLSFRANTALARALFSPATLVLYLGVLAYAGYAAWLDPRLRPNLQAFYLEQHLTLTLVALLGVYFITTMLHELGHMLAAARYGVHSRLGIGNRLWELVAEADLTGILSLPRRQRYLPLMAGMMIDVLNIALLSLAVGWLLDHNGNPFAVQLLQALVLQLMITISWQFNIFLRTDFYYVVCNYFGHPDLDQQARLYLRDRLNHISGGRFGAAAAPGAIVPRNLGVLRAFSLLWVVGRISALLLLMFVLIPTLSRYVARAYDSFISPTATRASAIDAAAFAAISIALLAAGMYLWLRRR